MIHRYWFLLRNAVCRAGLLILPCLAILFAPVAGATEHEGISTDPEVVSMLPRIIQNVPSGVGVERYHVIQGVNNYITNILGYSREELIGQNIRMLYPSDRDFEEVVRNKYIQTKTEGTSTLETRWSTKDGRVLNVVLSSTPLDPGDLSVGVTFTVLDITARKQAEAALEKRTQWFLFGLTAIVLLLLVLVGMMFTSLRQRKLAQEALKKKSEELELYFTSSLDLLCIADVDGRFVRLNSEWEKVLGYSISELEGRMFLDFVHPDDMESTLAAISRLENQEQILNFENRYRTTEGEYRWIEWRSKLMGHHIYAAARDITERKQAEEKLKLSENKLRQVIDLVPHCIFAKDADGKFILVNTAVAEVYGTNAEDLIGKSDYDFNPNEDEVRHFIECDRKVIESGKGLYSIEEVITDSKGEKRHLETTKIPFTASGSEKPAMLAVSVNITERKRTEESLLESEEMQRKLLQTVPDLIIRTDLEGTITFVNELAFPALGNLPQKSIWGKNIFSFVAKNDLPRALENARQRLEKNIGSQEYQLVLDDFVVDVEVNGAVIRDKDSRAVGMVYVIRDITDRKRAEEVLQESEKKYRELFENAPVGIFQTTPEGRFLSLNPNYARIIGYATPQEVIEQVTDIAAQIYVRPEERERFKDHLRQHGSAINYVVELKRLDGKSVWVSMNTKVQRGSEGQVVYSGFLTDITDSKRAEKEHEKLQILLHQAQKMESLGTLAGGVAHDFNNLLHVMHGNIELLLRGKPEDHSDAKRLRAVTKAMGRAAQLVQQLLLFGRKAESRKVRVDLNQEVQGVARILERTIPKMIAFELNLFPEAWPLLADPVQIEQILLNLASNALDAMPDGGKLVVETRNVVLDGEFAKNHPGSFAGPSVLLSVTDTGCGMDRDILNHIFDPFFTTKEMGKGTGLGLASVYGIVEGHGGYIQCNSEPGEGTTFRIYLPAVEQGGFPEVESLPESSPQGGSETILVVDDDAQIRELTQEALEMLGYSVRMAANGEEALDIYMDEGKSIDLVLLDLNMPGMGGYRCLHELLQLDASVKVVIATGFTANGHGKDSLPSGAKGFIGKPYQLKELAATVRRVLDEEE